MFEIHKNFYKNNEYMHFHLKNLFIEILIHFLNKNRSYINYIFIFIGKIIARHL
jgi:hypothetical protein